MLKHWLTDISQNHFLWLEKYLPSFFNSCGIDWNNHCGIVSAHGDKGSSYRHNWERHGIHYFHGMAIFLLTYCKPYSNEVRKTASGWVNPEKWVIDNYPRFKARLPYSDLGDKNCHTANN